MNVLILGGNSKRHKAWVREVAVHLKDNFDEVQIHDYQHWQKDEREADVEFEVTAAATTAKDLGEYIIVAKSIGTVIALNAIAAHKLIPVACLFIGTPLSVIKEKYPNLKTLYSKLPPTTFLHNTQDPLGNSDDLKEFLSAHCHAKWNLIAVKDSTHDYTNFSTIRDLATKLR